MSGVFKTCSKCGETFPATADHFYRNKGGKFGLTPRCKSCTNQDNAEGHARRLAADPEKIRRMATERSMRSYRKDLVASRARQSAHQAKRRADPVMGAIIKARKRAAGAGLSPEALTEMLIAQGNCCAICGSTSPGSKIGWNLDHCHQSKQVRFILCAHCNRGLGAFKDKPELLRKAANMLEAFYQNQAAGAQAAILEGL